MTTQSNPTKEDPKSEETFLLLLECEGITFECTARHACNGKACEFELPEPLKAWVNPNAKGKPKFGVDDVGVPHLILADDFLLPECKTKLRALRKKNEKALRRLTKAA